LRSHPPTHTYYPALLYQVRVLTIERFLPDVCDGPERNGGRKEMSIIKRDFYHKNAIYD
jgi:hypothetical protein